MSNKIQKEGRLYHKAKSHKAKSQAGIKRSTKVKEKKERLKEKAEKEEHIRRAKRTDRAGITDRAEITGRAYKEDPNALPKGIRVLIVYSGIIAFFYLLLVFLSDMSIFFGFLTRGLSARLTHFLFFISTIVIMYGLSYRKRWCHIFSIAVYLVCIINSLVSIFFLKGIGEELITSLYSILMPFFLVTLIMNVLPLWYLYEKRHYFTSGRDDGMHCFVDKVFIYAIYMFYIFAGLFILVSGTLFFVNAVSNIEHVMSITAGMDVADSQAYCESLPSEEARDFCFLSVVQLNSGRDGEEDISKLCSSISSGYYRFTCYKVVRG
ncbi:hypothetical protein JXB31_04075 [Candidatus Woesearchaeota archaeon]|nr:hypothetical protein [Candidatus Woesearchaeota archaeon]